MEQSKQTEKLCNLCGLSCKLIDSYGYNPISGLIDATVQGGYFSTPGNGEGALDDGEVYKFSLCEFCLDWLFSQFKIPVDQRYSVDTRQRTVFRPAAIRVEEDGWRKLKSLFYKYFSERNAARGLKILSENCND